MGAGRFGGVRGKLPQAWTSPPAAKPASSDLRVIDRKHHPHQRWAGYARGQDLSIGAGGRLEHEERVAQRAPPRNPRNMGRATTYSFTLRRATWRKRSHDGREDVTTLSPSRSRGVSRGPTALRLDSGTNKASPSRCPLTNTTGVTTSTSRGFREISCASRSRRPRVRRASPSHRSPGPLREWSRRGGRI